MILDATSPQSTVFLYTQEQRGNQLVESILVGSISDYAGMEKFVVIRDPFSDITFVYRIHHESRNLDAIAITDQPDDRFDGKSTTQINSMTYKLGTPETALRLLNGHTEWVQDKGSILSVLLHNAAASTPDFSKRRISRDRLKKVPSGTPVEYLAHAH